MKAEINKHEKLSLSNISNLLEQQILLRLIDDHPSYGKAGRSYPHENWFVIIPWFDRALFEMVNTSFTDYTYSEVINGDKKEIYLK